MTTEQKIILYIAIGLVATIIVIVAISKLSRSMFAVDRMSGTGFEKFVARIYSKLGYKTRSTKTSGDQGIDVIAQKGFISIGIQTKRYNKNVGNEAVQEAVAGKRYYKLSKVAVVTNRYFTRSAKELAKVNGVELVDRDELKKLIKKAYRRGR